MKIAELAREVGVGVETVRYYQRRGLLEVPQRPFGTDGGIRRYDDTDLRRLRFIRAAQAAGFTLEQIAELIALEASHERTRVRELAEARIVALDARIEELEIARDALRRLATQCQATATGPCPILTAFQTD